MRTIAVLIAGEFRTWSKCSEYLFHFFENRAEQIDYFFATWTTSHDLPGKHISESDIRNPFNLHKKNLVGINVIPQIGRKVSTFYNQAYLAKVANILKRESEIKNNFVYDQVVEVRPDIYIRPSNRPWILLSDYEVCNCGHMITSQNGFDAIDDVYYRSNSITNDIIANRYWYRKSPEHYTHIEQTIENWHNHHTMIMEYFTLNGIKFMKHQIDFVSPHIAVRQEAVDVDFNIGKLEELKEKYQPSFHSWQKPDNRPINWH